MRVLQRPNLRSLAWLSGIGLLVGCTGQTAMLGPRPPATYTASRTAEGRACTFLVLGVIPSSNFQRRDQIAYERALSHGGRALTDTTIQYSWYMIPYVGDLHCTRIAGDPPEARSRLLKRLGGREGPSADHLRAPITADTRDGGDKHHRDSTTLGAG